MSEQQSDDPDFHQQFWQDTPECRAILQFLRSMTAHFQDIQRELTDAEWTAFRALTKVGAMEGIMRTECTTIDGKHEIIFRRVAGDYIKAMPDDPCIRMDHPIDVDLIQARLTGIGERWAGFLAQEITHPLPARGLVLTMQWRAEPVRGMVTIVKGPVKNQSQELVAASLQSASPPPEPSPGSANNAAVHYIDMDQAAALVNRSKKTLERALRDGDMPMPDVQGMGGKKHEWEYAKLKPWLEKNYDRILPDQPPHTIR